MLIEYKKFLDDGTNEGLRYVDESKSRFVSFDICLKHLTKINNPKILELGTSRSFVNGCFPGCNSNNTKYWNKNDPLKWDWGAGCFTVIFGLLSNSNITTLDIINNHIYRSKHMTDSFGIININHIVSDSVVFLKNTKEKYDLIYLDTGDMWPIEPTMQLQLEEAKVIVEMNLLNKNGILLIDDVLNGTPKELGAINNKYGKSDYSIPYLIANNFNIIFEGYQYILSK